MAKDAYYFSHDSNARNDEKIISLRMNHGWEGYGIYWALIEMLRDSANHELEMDYNRIAFALHADCDLIKSLITDYDLFAIDAGLFWSISLKIRMEKKDIKSKKAKAAADKRWKSEREKCGSDANALPEQSAPNARKVKESKEKESKYSLERIEKIKKSTWLDWDLFQEFLLIRKGKGCNESIMDKSVSLLLESLTKNKTIANEVLKKVIVSESKTIDWAIKELSTPVNPNVRRNA